MRVIDERGRSAVRATLRWAAAVGLSALAAQPVHAEALPANALERECWLDHTRERTRVARLEPTAVDMSNLRDGQIVATPFRVDFSIRGLGVVPAGKPHPKAGHHHLLLNTPLPAVPGEKIPFNEQHRHFGKGQTGTTLTLPPGQHRLRLLFADHEHRPYYVFSPEIVVLVRGPRSGPPPRITRAAFEATCRAWYDEELSRPRPEGQRAVITNVRDGEPVVSPFNLRFAVDGFGVAPRGHGGDGLGHFMLDVLRIDGRPVQAVDLSHGATQATLRLPNGNYVLRLRFLDDSGRVDLLPAAVTGLVVTAQDRF